MQVTVVFDGAEADAQETWGLLSDLGVRCESTGARSNANRARNLGIQCSDAPYVALLDDDDVWSEFKLARQLEALLPAAQGNPLTLCTTAVRTVGARPGRVWPERGPWPSERIGDYLFRRRTFRPRPHFLQTSTWLAPRALFDRVPFDESLTLHQDWDWMLRASTVENFTILHLQDPLVEYLTSTAQSASSDASKWQASLTWAITKTAMVSRRARGDLILNSPLLLALRSGKFANVVTVFRAAHHHGQPSFRAVSVAIAKAMLASRSLTTSRSTLPLSVGRPTAHIEELS